jgi:hypothetical protein
MALMSLSLRFLQIRLSSTHPVRGQYPQALLPSLLKFGVVAEEVEASVVVLLRLQEAAGAVEPTLSNLISR